MAGYRKGKQVTLTERNTDITVVANVANKLRVKVKGGPDGSSNSKSRK